MELASGEYLADRFQVINRLAVGGESSLYLAADRSNQSELGSLQVLVAIQVINQKKLNRLILKEELEILKQIKSDYLLNVYEIIQEKKRLAVTLEPFDASFLVEQMKSRIFSTFEIMQILHRLASGIEALHINGLVHGQISEWTILINQNDHLKLETLSRLYRPDLSKNLDIKALGVLGLQLLKGTHYRSRFKILNYVRDKWKIEISRDPKLINFIEKLLNWDTLLSISHKEKGQQKYSAISEVREELEALIVDINESRANHVSEYCLVLNSNLVIMGIVSIIFLTLALIASVTLHIIQ